MIKLIACDLDRTLLPNGHEPNDNGLELFSKFVEMRNFTLVYASGRNWKLFEEARSEFPLPLPDYFFGDVGTVLYKKVDDHMEDDDSWLSYIASHTPKWDWGKIKALTTNPGAYLQEEWRQNAYKLSYYVTDTLKGKVVADAMRKILDAEKIGADVVYSVDPLKNVGLIDILPLVATKVTGIEFLRERFNLEKNEVAYCGDSGNDILPLTFGYNSILVANASREIKDTVTEVNNEKGYLNNLYIARGNGIQNGNYASGVLEGLNHFGVLS